MTAACQPGDAVLFDNGFGPIDATVTGRPFAGLVPVTPPKGVERLVAASRLTLAPCVPRGTSAPAASALDR